MTKPRTYYSEHVAKTLAVKGHLDFKKPAQGSLGLDQSALWLLVYLFIKMLPQPCALCRRRQESDVWLALF